MTDNVDTDLQDAIPENAVSDEGVSGENEQSKAFDSATVQKIVARERRKAYEKGKSEALMQLEEQQQETQQSAPVQQQAPQSLGGMPQMSQADIERLIAEKIPAHLHEQVQDIKNKQFVDSFVGKMQAAEQQHPGLEAKLNKLDYNKPGTRALIEMANSLENTGDIMKELLDHPRKMGTILNLLYEQPYLAQEELNSLSNSIKQNQAATAQHQSSNQPISQIKPSANAGMNNDNLSVSDYRKMFRA